MSPNVESPEITADCARELQLAADVRAFYAHAERLFERLPAEVENRDDLRTLLDEIRHDLEEAAKLLDAGDVAGSRAARIRAEALRYELTCAWPPSRGVDIAQPPRRS